MKQLTPNQRQALHWMSKKPLEYCVAGFGTDLQPGRYWNSQTVMSLEARGLCTIAGKGLKRVARITRQGRRVLGGTISGPVNTCQGPEGER
ncbi:MAG: hypothetical protein J0H42_04310 [Rhizobiales bacterium]|nr:hypothetical protein [Hyphomicrobiales bacterium]